MLWWWKIQWFSTFFPSNGIGMATIRKTKYTSEVRLKVFERILFVRTWRMWFEFYMNDSDIKIYKDAFQIWYFCLLYAHCKLIILHTYEFARKYYDCITRTAEEWNCSINFWMWKVYHAILLKILHPILQRKSKYYQCIEYICCSFAWSLQIVQFICKINLSSIGKYWLVKCSSDVDQHVIEMRRPNNFSISLAFASSASSSRPFANE